ncbi:MAG TPA: hypothetical protein PKN99_08415 [Cyclobacteriaceae bacterium]|nr:hypothetical protein [Cyclobacteriaceae bacterium]
MKRTPLIITLVIIILSGGVVWVYQRSQEDRISPWSLVSSDASLVVEVNNLQTFGQKISLIPVLNKALISNEIFDLYRQQKIPFLSKALISIHPSSRDDYELVFYGDVNTEIINQQLEQFEQSLGAQLTPGRRSYNGIEIHEFFKDKKSKLSYATVDNVIVISESSFLLEGALRMRNATHSERFREANALLFKLPALQSDEGNLYLNAANFEAFVRLFLSSSFKNAFEFHGASLADIKVNENSILLNGFMQNLGGGVLELFVDQRPQSIDIDPLVSNRTSVLLHFGISDPALWFENQKEYLTSRDVKSVDSLESTLNQLSVSISSLRKSIGNQFAFCYLQSSQDIVTLLKLSESGNEVSVFDELSSKIAAEKKDTVYIENYSGYSIKLIDHKNFIRQLLYPFGNNSDQSFFVQIGDQLLISENVELIKVFIDDIDNENTWGKSVEWNRYLGNALQESNISLFLDGKLTSVLLREQVNDHWRPFVDSTKLVALDKGSFQLSHLESNFYLNALLQFGAEPVSKPARNIASFTSDFGASINSSIWPVKSHLAKEIELVLQDSLNNFCLLSKELKPLWKVNVGQGIKGEVSQIDFYANGKFQYFFTTGDAIHIVDRLGRYVDGFPKHINSAKDFRFSTVVDYDRSKRYRYLLSDVKGNCYLTDKDGNALEGWNPLTLNSALQFPGSHHRVLGKDYFVMFLQNGSVQLLNRRGEKSKGFPLDLGFKPQGDYFLSIGSSLGATRFTVVSNEGLKLQFGLDGQIRSRDVLLKKAGTSRFALVRSGSNASFVIMRVDPSRIAVIDEDGSELFEVENAGSMDLRLSYIENRLKERFYCLYDEQQNFTYLFNSEGVPMIAQPIESTELAALYFNETTKTLEVYNVNGSSLSLISLKTAR